MNPQKKSGVYVTVVVPITGINRAPIRKMKRTTVIMIVATKAPAASPVLIL
jgi:hypothetical protein